LKWLDSSVLKSSVTTLQDGLVAGKLAVKANLLKLRIGKKLANPENLLFVLALGVYLLTRFWSLDRFPIYFFSDEAQKRLSPYQGWMVFTVVETSHAMTGCIKAAANIGGRLGDNFIESGGLLGQFCCQPLEVIKKIVCGWSQPDVVFSIMVPES